MTTTATPTHLATKPAAPASAAFKPSSETTRAQCKRIFGEAHPEDVLAPLKMATEAIYWFESLFIAIEDCPDVTHHIKNLAGMDRYVAADIGNIADAALEEMGDAVKKEKDQ